MTRAEQFDRVATGVGFIAALDQSGGSTPATLREYGVPEGAWGTDAEMFDLVHAMRARVITSPAFDGGRILGTILFQQTMERQVEGMGTAEYLWQRKRIVPFLKIDHGLAESGHGVRLMKPVTGLDDLLARARTAGIFGTKMRSLVQSADADGINSLLDQQFDHAVQVLRAGLVPIVEPEVDIASPDKQEAEKLLAVGLTDRLSSLDAGAQVLLKLSLPSVAGYYGDLIRHPRVLRVVALSGGYGREEANRLLGLNPGVVASFSRALLEGLTMQQSEEEFDHTLDRAVASIYAASTT